MPLNVTIKPMHHRGAEVMGVFFSYNNDLTAAIKKIKGIKWSQTHKCWYLPIERKGYNEVCKMLPPDAVVDNSNLRRYLLNKNVLKTGAPDAKMLAVQARPMLRHPLNEENTKALAEYIKQIKLKGYSAKTLATYKNEFVCLLRLLGNVSVTSLGKTHIESYLLWLVAKKKYSEAHVHTAVNAIKFYFEQVAKRGREFYDLPRPKKPQKLPQILAEEEIVNIVQKIQNKKHAALILTAYAGGLRVSELVTLQLTDIDSKRMIIHIKNSKGKKDRIVPLSKKLLAELRAYFIQYRPKTYLFEGADGGPYSPRSAQEVLKMAKHRAGIKKKGSIHSLRHAYATHLLEAGTDIRYIQAFLGHNNIKTTLLYTRVTKPKLDQIGSPLDKLNW